MSDSRNDAVTDDPSCAPAAALAHEVEPTVGLAQRHVPTAERELAMVDRILVLENKLAEANHRYKLAADQQYYGLQYHAVPPPWSRSRAMYTKLLRVPVLGAAARSTLRAVRRLRRTG